MTDQETLSYKKWADELGGFDDPRHSANAKTLLAVIGELESYISKDAGTIYKCSDCGSEDIYRK